MKSKILSEILSEVTPEIESKVEQKTLEIMEAITPENSFLDLSKLSEEQQIKAISLLPDKVQPNQYEILESHYKLYFDSVNWWVLNGVEVLNKTELTYPEFIKLFEGGDEKSVEELLSDIDYWATKYEFTFQFWGDANNNLFIRKGGVSMYDNGGLETPKEAILDALKYINKVNRTKF